MTKSKPKPTLTDVLRAAIEESGLTRYRIARGAGVDESILMRFVRREMSIRLDKADRLAAYLGLQLVADPDAKPPEPTPENLARPMLAKRKKRRKAN
jgi:transcriptional regulator with XRE-family HTH domain